jgi:hypothetical protein
MKHSPRLNLEWEKGLTDYLPKKTHLHGHVGPGFSTQDNKKKNIIRKRMDQLRTTNVYVD